MAAENKEETKVEETKVEEKKSEGITFFYNGEEHNLTKAQAQELMAMGAAAFRAKQEKEAEQDKEADVDDKAPTDKQVEKSLDKAVEARLAQMEERLTKREQSELAARIENKVESLISKDKFEDEDDANMLRDLVYVNMQRNPNKPVETVYKEQAKRFKDKFAKSKKEYIEEKEKDHDKTKTNKGGKTVADEKEKPNYKNFNKNAGRESRVNKIMKAFS